jgi:hypothetical protein
MYTVIMMNVVAPIQQCLLLQISLLEVFYDFIIVYKALQFSYFFTISNHSLSSFKFMNAVIKIGK